MATTTYELSDLDKTGFTKSVKAVLFYDIHGADPESLMSSFRLGVCNATQSLPFMAGHLHFNESGKLCIVTSPDSSIEVSVRHFTNTELPPFAVLAQGFFSPTLDLSPFLPEGPKESHPVCLIQLGVMEGGLAIGFQINHAAGDWVSIDTFFSLVCQGTKAHQEGQALPLPTNPLDLNRTPFNTPAPDPRISQEDRLAQLPLFHVLEKSKFKFNPAAPTRAGIFRITESTIQQLKEQSKPHLEGVEYITSYDCISALVWTALTRARVAVHPEKAACSSRFVHPIDVRSRDPENKTSNGYFGNAVIGTLAGPITADILTKTDTRSLAVAASQVRRSINAINVSTITHMTALQASLPDTHMLIPNADFADMDLFMNTWYTGTAAKYDIGGAAGPGPVAFRVQAGMPGACAMILPNLSGGTSRVFEVYVQAAVDEFRVLASDGEFLRFFEHVV
ncbi:transferase [Aspergillus karnatakaensis]|uniref:acyltransferase helD1 n=1 Tax=Aspergillus karnatakaensis TaxID=1810916 RepID=UPI003CCD8255